MNLKSMEPIQIAKMPFYDGSFKTLEELEMDYFQLTAPKSFSFVGVLARICQPADRSDNGSLEVRHFNLQPLGPLPDHPLRTTHVH